MRISIIGCGWLGLPLAKNLLSKGHTVLGSTTSEDKLATLEKAGIRAFLLKMTPEPEGELEQLLQADLVFINIPPKSRTHSADYHEKQIDHLRKAVDRCDAEHIIFISSTSYYPNINQIVTSETQHDLDKGSTEAVVLAEEAIKQSGKNLMILRCGGLLGVDRIPGKWFAGKETSGANTPVNYVHRDDAIQVITHFIEKGFKGTLVKNLVADDHPTKKDVHENMAEKYGFEKPIWKEPALINSKIVKSDFGDFGLRSPLAF